MSSKSFINPSFRNGPFGLFARHRRLFRILGHGLMWVLVYLILIRGATDRLFADNARVINTAAAQSLVQTVGLFYFVGYYVFPAFFYRRDYLRMLLILTGLFFLVYQMDYQLFGYLATISDQTGPDGRPTYARSIHAMLTEAGRLGCFTSRRVALWNLAYGCFYAMILLVVKAFRDIIGYQKRLVEVERDKIALELNFLKAQVNPHFLFNTLNSVYARIFDTDEQAATLVLKLSELMRYNLYETDQPRIGLDKELEYIQNYLDLERNRLDDQTVVIDYEQSGEPAAYQIAPLLLIAYVENAFKHGVKGATLPAYVQVRAAVDGGRLDFTVENSVPPRRTPSRSQSRSGGIGLENVRKRLDALYPDRYSLTVDAREDTYTVQLTLQLEPL